MVKSIYFNQYNTTAEQRLVEDLVIESIRQTGLDMVYIPRSLVNYNNFYGEDPVSEYTSGYQIEMYVRNVQQFSGDGDFLSKFGLQINDSVTLTVAKRVFTDEIGNKISTTRPREGDLIYFPLNQKIFIIKFVEHEAIFYQLGALQTFDCQCDLWQYSNEIMDTGIEEIDQLQTSYSFAMTLADILTEDQYSITDEDGYPIVQESFDLSTQVGQIMSNNDDIQQDFSDILNQQGNPLGEIKIQ